MPRKSYGSIEEVENGWVVCVQYTKPDSKDELDYTQKQFIYAEYDDAEKALRSYFEML